MVEEERVVAANKALKEIAKSFTECKVTAKLVFHYGFMGDGWQIVVKIGVPNLWGGTEDTSVWYGHFSQNTITLLGYNKRTQQKWRRRIAKKIEEAKLSNKFYYIWKQEEVILKKILMEATKLRNIKKLNWLEKIDIQNFTDIIEQVMHAFEEHALQKELQIKKKKGYIKKIEHFYNARIKKIGTEV